MEWVLGVINGIGNGISGFLGSLISLNYLVGDNLYSLLRSLILGSLDLVIGVKDAFWISLHDFGIFLHEILSLIAIFVNAIHHFVETILGHAVASLNYLHNSLINTLVTFIHFLSSIWTNVGHFCRVLGSCILLLLGLLPQSAIIAYKLALSFSHALINYLTQTGSSLFQTLGRRDPLETALGILAGSLISYTCFKTAQRLIRRYDITPQCILTALIKLLCLSYVSVITVAFALIKLVVRGVEITLMHLGPTFHQVGHFEEDLINDNNYDGGVIMDVDDSDDDENARMDAKRSRVKKLLGRRGNRGGTPGRIEDELVQQVEREREDKLCVVCQDSDKCIMILPCRHLCICQGCQGPLLKGSNVKCPICRKAVRQTIKAYL